jgi:hypothetical protein
MFVMALLITYGVVTTILIIRMSLKDSRRETELGELYELAINHRKLVNELQSIGEAEANALIDLERKR